jgi:hypothetical protein
MSSVFEVDHDDIERLSDVELTDLLRRLLLLEAGRQGIAAGAIQVPLKIDVPDGGEDGRIEWTGGPAADPNNWLPNRTTLYQVKATDMSPEAAAKEVLRKRKKGEEEADPLLKPRVQQVVEAGGAYVLFWGKNCNAKMADARVDKIRGSLRGAQANNCETCQIRVFGSSEIAAWTNQFAAAVTFVLTKVGRLPPLGAMTWAEWANYKEHSGIFFWDAKREEHAASLRSLLGEERKAARLVGLSGYGKTRLALETFRPPASTQSDHSVRIVSDSVVYVIADHTPNLPADVRSWRAVGQSGLLIVDECPVDLHRALAREVEHQDSRFSLLTIDYDPTHKPGGAAPLVTLDALDKEGIQSIIKEDAVGVGEDEVRRLAAFAEGFPRIAVLFKDADVTSEGLATTLDDEQLVERLVWGREQPDQKSLEILQACALFDHFAIAGRDQHEAEFIAEKMCSMSFAEFRTICERFIARKILYRRGDRLRVTPPPLALQLSSRWFARHDVETIGALLTKRLPHGMVDALARQLGKLDFLPKAQEVVEELCSPTGPFSRREFLNSSAGSRLVSALAEVNPAAVIDVIDRVLGNLSPEDISQIEDGRRDLVWALEKLCWWPETFGRAARMMRLFAVGENETWGNNATNQFAQLYQVYLSGTQVPAMERLPLLDEALASDRLAEKLIAVKAMQAALATGVLTRSGGVETQGSRLPGKDWHPETGKAIYEYWKAVLERLVGLARTATEEGSAAKQAIAETARGVIGKGGIKLIEDAVQKVTQASAEPWPAMDNAIRLVMRFEGKKASDEVQQRFEGILATLAPTSTRAKIEMLVRLPSFADTERDESGQYVDRAALRAQAFARELAQTPEDVLSNLDLLVSGEIRGWYAFGHELGRAFEDRQTLVEGLLERLDAADSKVRNPYLVAAVLAGVATVDRELVASQLDQLTSRTNLVPFIVDFTRVVGPRVDDLSRLLRLIQSGSLAAKSLMMLNAGGVFHDVSAKEVCQFAAQLAAIDAEAAAVASDIMVMYTWNDEARYASCRACMRDILARPGTYSAWSALGSHADFHVEHLTTRLLSDDPMDSELAEVLAKEILEVFDRGVTNLPRSATPALEGLLEKHYSVVWPKMRHCLVHGSHRQVFLLADRMRENKDPRLGSGPVIGLRQYVPDQDLIQWLSEQSEALPIVSSLCNPLADPTGVEPYPSWSALAVELIDQHGDNEEVLGHLARNIHTRAWSGSAIPGIDLRIAAFDELKNHSRAKVRCWVSDELAWLRKARVAELKREEEHDFGVFR